MHDEFLQSASEGSAFALTRVAREQVAELIGAHSMDVIFTSCATESNNAAIAAALSANPAKRHIVTSQVEHSSVLNYSMALEKQSQDSPQSTQRSQGTARQSASVFSVPSVVDGSSGAFGRLRSPLLHQVKQQKEQEWFVWSGVASGAVSP